MALTLYVDTARWRAHHKHVQEQFPGLVPVCKGNGYGFGHEKLAEEATRLGSDILAVGTTYEAARIKDWFSGDLLVLTPYRRAEEPVPLPDRAPPTPPLSSRAAWWRNSTAPGPCGCGAMIC